jgi:hypothetical protein
MDQSSKIRQRGREGTGHTIILQRQNEQLFVFQHIFRDRARKEVVVQIQELQAWHSQKVSR